MTLISRYVLKEYLRIFFLTGVTLLSLFIIISLFELLTDALEHKASLVLVLKYLAMKIPQALYFMAPLVLLVSTILCMGSFSRSNELTAMNAGGIGIGKIVFPIFIVAALVSAAIFFNSEYLLPYANTEMQRIHREEIKGEPARGVQQQDNLWYKSDDGSIWKIGLLNNEGSSLRNIILLNFGKDGKILKRIDSKRADWNGREWIFFDSWVREFKDGGNFNSIFFKENIFSVTEKPSDFVIIRKSPDKMSYKEIGLYIEKIKKEGLDPTEYLVEREAKLSFPFICIVLVLTGLPFSLKNSRQGGMMLGIGIGVSIGFAIWFSYSICLSMGRSGKIPVLLSAWGAELFFTVLGIALLIKNRR